MVRKSYKEAMLDREGLAGRDLSVWSAVFALHWKPGGALAAMEKADDALMEMRQEDLDILG